MENRRPPRNNSSGHTPPYGRDRNDPRRGPTRNSPRSGDGSRDQASSRPAQYSRDGLGKSPSSESSSGRGGRFSQRDRFGTFRTDGPPGTRGRNSGVRQPSRGRGQRPLRPIEAEQPLYSELQLSDGKYRAKLLENSLSPNAVPTSRKLREIMFKVVSRRVKAGRMLDLGAGMGMVGIEALSRGAMAVTFVERSAKMCSYLKKNLQVVGIKDGHGEVREIEILPFLLQAGKRRRVWDLVFFGTRESLDRSPAYEYFRRGIPVAAGGLLLIEHPAGDEFPENIGILQRWRTITNNDWTITFYQRR